jgi:hypothetical protein
VKAGFSAVILVNLTHSPESRGCMSRFFHFLVLYVQKQKIMKAVRVTYTVKPSFVAENIENIKQFMAEVRKIGDPGMRYTVFLAEDGKTFSHLSSYTNNESQSKFLALASFKSFQEKRDASGLESEPTIETYSFVDSSHKIA